MFAFTSSPHDDSLIQLADRQLLKLLGAQTERQAEDKWYVDDKAWEWQEISERAAEMSLSTLLFGAIRQSRYEKLVPVEIYRKLQGDYTTIALRNMLLYRGLHTILGLLQTHSIGVIPLKGIFLAQNVYRDIGLRPMSDIDLLVRIQDLENVRRLLENLGYTRDNANRDDTSIDEDAGREPQEIHHDRFTHVGHGLDVEVHWGLVKPNSPFDIDYGALWQRATMTQIAGLPAHVLSPIDTVLHLCIHLCYQHIFQRYSLRSLCDIQRVIYHYGKEIDWLQLCERTEEWRAERSVHLALLLAHELLHADVPPFVLARLRPAHLDERLTRWATHRVLGKVDDRIGPWSSNTGRLHLATPWSEKLAIVWQMAVPPQPQIAKEFQLPANAPHLWFFYLRHWSKLARSLLSASVRPRLGSENEATISWNEREIGRTALTEWLHEKRK